jgi:diacylglycerol kinase family enzyme
MDYSYDYLLHSIQLNDDTQTRKKSDLKMYLLLNTYAGGGSAEKKWVQIKNTIIKKFNNLKIIKVDKSSDTNSFIQDAIAKKENDFIIAGGDGTVNLFINKLMDQADKKDIKGIRIGAIGIGSSNDFHKPMYNCLIAGIPAKINFNSYEQRDVGLIKYKVGTQLLQKYFLLNASIGVTAEANNLFNNPDLVLRFLKKYFTGVAILYSALKTIFSYKNIEAKIIFNSNESYLFQISNLSIIKNPNISGDLSYPSDPDYQNGLYDIYLTHSMNKLNLINLLKSLSNKVFPKNEKTKYCKTSKIKVSSESEFLIEFDGEVIKTNYAEFSILNRYLKVCTS